MARLTSDQRHILTVLSEYVHPPSVRQLTDNLERPGYRRAHWSIDQVGSSLRRMERRGLVQHVDGRRAHGWSLTIAGSNAIYVPCTECEGDGCHGPNPAEDGCKRCGGSGCEPRSS